MENTFRPSRFLSLRATTPSPCTWEEIMQELTGERHAATTTLFRALAAGEGQDAETSKRQQSQIKQNQPAFVPSVHLEGGRSSKHIKRLSGLHYGGHRRHPRRDLRRDPRTGRGRPALVPCLQDLVRTRHTCHRMDGRRSDGRELPRSLADGKRLLRPAHRHRHRQAVQERHAHVRDLPRPRRALPSRRRTDEVRLPTRRQGRTKTGHRRRKETQRAENIGRTRREHRTPACGRRGRTLRSRQPQRLHQPMPLPDEPFRRAGGRSFRRGPSNCSPTMTRPPSAPQPRAATP